MATARAARSDELVSLHEPHQVLSRLERAHRQEIGPAHPESSKQAGRAKVVPIGEVVGSFGHDEILLSLMPTPAANSAAAVASEGTTMAAARAAHAAGPPRASAGLFRVGLRHRSPGDVVNRQHE